MICVYHEQKQLTVDTEGLYNTAPKCQQRRRTHLFAANDTSTLLHIYSFLLILVFIHPYTYMRSFDSY